MQKRNREAFCELVRILSMVSAFSVHTLPSAVGPSDSEARTISGKRPSLRSLQRSQEYYDWLLELPEPHRDDADLDDSWARFMKERRAHREHERYERRHGTRTPRQSAKQQNGMTAWERRCANDAAVASGAIARPRGQVCISDHYSLRSIVWPIYTDIRSTLRNNPAAHVNILTDNRERALPSIKVG